MDTTQDGGCPHLMLDALQNEDNQVWIYYPILESQRPSLEQNMLFEGQGHGEAWYL